MNSPAVSAPTSISRPLTVGDLLDWTLRLYRARFSRQILTTAIFLVPIGLVSGIINGQTMTGYVNILLAVLQNGVFPEEQFLNTMNRGQDALAGLSCLLLPISFVATGIVSLALTYQSLSTLRNQESTIMESINVGWRRFWPWLGMTLTMAIAFIGLMIAIVILVAIAGFALALVFGGIFSAIENVPTGEGIAAGIGFLVAIICVYALILAAIFGPIAYFYGRWAVSVPGIVDQGWGAVESLQESWSLTRGNAWRCMGYMVLLYLLYSVFYVAILALGFGLSTLVITTSSLASVIVFAILGAVFPVLWQPIQIAAHVMLYHDLRIRNESYDLEMQISQLEDEVAASEPHDPTEI